MGQICQTWNNANVKWKDATWKWSRCSDSSRICQTWSNTDVKWKDADWIWSECQLVSDIIVSGGVDATTLVQPWMIKEPWNPYKKIENVDNRNRLIRLICKVKNMEYVEEKKMKDFKITINDLKLVVNMVSGIDLNLKLEE